MKCPNLHNYLLLILKMNTKERVANCGMKLEKSSEGNLPKQDQQISKSGDAKTGA